jgi:hypothetical protein
LDRLAGYSRRAGRIGTAEEVLETRGRAAMIRSPKSGTPEKMSQPRLILIEEGVLVSLGMKYL